MEFSTPGAVAPVVPADAIRLLQAEAEPAVMDVSVRML